MMSCMTRALCMYVRPMFIATVLVLAALSQAVLANENVVTVRGIARIEYAPSEDHHGLYRKLVHEAKIAAIKTYMATMPQAKLRLMDRYFDDITSYENIDKYVLSFKPLGGPCNTGVTKNGKPKCGQIKDKSLNLAVNAKISTVAIDNYLQSQSVVGATGAGESSEFGVMFIARTTTGKTVFDDKVTNVQQQQSQDNTNTTMASDGTSNIAGVSQESLSVSTTGGSTEVKADALSYQIDNALSNTLGQAIGQYLVDAGFEPISADEIVDNSDDLYYLDEMIDEGMFRDDGTMPRRLLNRYKKAAIEFGMKFFGVGRIDIGMAQKNAVTGFIEVPAIVTFEVFMDANGRSRSVAVVTPQAVYGEDARGDEAIARQNAQNEAVKLALDTVVSQLQAKDLY